MKIKESKFLTDLAVKNLDDENWLILEPLVYQSRTLGKTVEVPAGFQTDFASVPRLPLTFALTGDAAHKAAVIHDYLYRSLPHICQRRTADLVFYEAMKVTGIVWWRRELMFAGVRLGGSGSWRKPV